MKRSPQLKLFKPQKSDYGGSLLNTRKARSQGRPIDTKNTMHLSLRSTQAVGDWSFSKKKNSDKISEIVKKFSDKYGVRIISLANVGNHLHFHLKISNRFAYKKFIRAITSAIVMAITKVNKFKKLKEHFWNYRPFTRVVIGHKARLNIQNYIEINQLEGQGWNRAEAIDIIRDHKEKFG